MNEITIELKYEHFYDAGIIGLIRVLDKGNLNYQLTDDSVTFDPTELLFFDFSKHYFDYAIQKYEHEFLPCKKIMHGDFEIADLKRASYKTAYKIIGYEPDYKNRKSVIEYFIENQRFLTITDIKYRYLTTLIGGFNYTLPKNAHKHSEHILHEFLNDLCHNTPVSNNKKNKICPRCGNLRENLLYPKTWHHEVDSSRKKSPYWNFSPEMLCEIDQLVYLCTPLGYRVNNVYQAIFIRSGGTIQTLLHANSQKNFYQAEFDAVFKYHTAEVVRFYKDRFYTTFAETKPVVPKKFYKQLRTVFLHNYETYLKVLDRLPLNNYRELHLANINDLPVDVYSALIQLCAAYKR